MDPSGKWVLSVDLGADKIFIYTLDKGVLIPHLDKTISARAGSGPRHLVFHPNGRYFYVIAELDNTLTSYQWFQETGTARSISLCSTLPSNYEG
jgi:6-phosphogluconolactonase